MPVCCSSTVDLLRALTLSQVNKAFFANERTFLEWMNTAALIAGTFAASVLHNPRRRIRFPTSLLLTRLFLCFLLHLRDQHFPSGIGVVIRTTRAQSGFNEGSLLIFVAIGVSIYATAIYYLRMRSLETVRGEGSSVYGAQRPFTSLLG